MGRGRTPFSACDRTPHSTLRAGRNRSARDTAGQQLPPLVYRLFRLRPALYNVAISEQSRLAAVSNYQQIREICARLLIAKDDEHFQAILTELKIALSPQISEAGPAQLHASADAPRRKIASDQ